MSLNDFQILLKLGKGLYSSVYKVRRIVDNQIYALKKVTLTNLTQKQKQNALNQAIILAGISHPHVIGYRQAFINQESQSLCIIMQYAEQGDLLSKIMKYKTQQKIFTQQQVWKILMSILKGLYHLHQLKIIHRDLKNANIFITKKNEIKIGDLNVSKFSDEGLCRTQTGTPFYASPQVWKDQPYNFKSDIWSLGCIIYQVATLKPPFNGQDIQALFKSVTRGIYPKIPSNYSNDLCDIIRLMLQTNHNVRPSSDKLINYVILKRRRKNIDQTIKINPQVRSQAFNIKNNLIHKSILKRNDIKCMSQHLPEPNYRRSRIKTQEDIFIRLDSNNLQSSNRSRLKSMPKSLLSSPLRTQKAIDSFFYSKNSISKQSIKISYYKVFPKGLNIVKQARKQVNQQYNSNRQQFQLAKQRQRQILRQKSQISSLVFNIDNQKKQKILSKLKNIKTDIISLKRINKRNNQVQYSQYKNLLERMKQIKQTKAQ